MPRISARRRAVAHVGSERARSGAVRRVAALVGLGLLVAAAPLVVRVQDGQAASSVHLVAAADFGATAQTDTVLRRMAALQPDAAFAVGDLAYEDLSPESAWCDYVKARVGDGFPFEVVAGNHEALPIANGLVNNYSACLPNQLPGAVGTYGREYYVDLPKAAPLVRVISVSPALTFEAGTWTYASGDSHYAWVERAIDQGRARGARWIIVNAHVPCLSVGRYACPANHDLTDLLLAKRVDLVLHGHEHAYMRTHQLRTGVPGCATLIVNGTDPDCIADDDSTFTAGAGTVFATVGTGGIALRDVTTTDPEGGYFAASSGSNRTPTWGLLDVRATEARLAATFVPTAGAGMTDGFTIDTATPGTVLARDTFDRAVAAGWGTAPTGGAWTINAASSASVTASQGRLAVPTGTTRTAYLRSVASATTDVGVSLGATKQATGTGLYIRLVGRAVPGAGEYHARARLRSDGKLEVRLVRTNAAGTETALTPIAVAPGTTGASGARFRIRLQVTGTRPTTLRVRVWQSTAPEPATWLATATDATAALQAPGGIGLSSYYSSAATNGSNVLVVDDVVAVVL